MAKKLSDRVAVVTGASGGIGRAVALAFAEEGADVIVHYWQSGDAAKEVVREITESFGRTAVSVQADLSRVEGADVLVRVGREQFRQIDIWANIAGYDILTGEGAALSDTEKLDRLAAVDLRGTVISSWAAAEAMRGVPGAVILNTSWDRVLTGAPGREAELFAAVKGGVLAFSKALARSLAPEIRVNVLAPGWIKTAFYETLDDRKRARITESTPLGRWGTPEDVARAAVFLASPNSDYLTGQVLLIGGGEVM